VKSLERQMKPPEEGPLFDPPEHTNPDCSLETRVLVEKNLAGM
jgi:hypothetical protein